MDREIDGCSRFLSLQLLDLYKSHDQFGQIFSDIGLEQGLLMDEKQEHNLAASLNLKDFKAFTALKHYSKALRTTKQPVELALLKRASQLPRKVLNV